MSAARSCACGCGRKTTRTAQLLRECDIATADALRWSEASIAPMRAAVPLRRDCEAFGEHPGYVARCAEGGAA